MFSTERSDFGPTIAGYLLVAAMFITIGASALNAQFDYPLGKFAVMDTMGALGWLLIGASVIALWKAYVLDGVTFLGAALIAMSMHFVFSPILVTVIFIAFLVAFMALRVCDYYVLALNAVIIIIAVLRIMLFAEVSFLVDNPLIVAIPEFVAGLFAAALCINDWVLFQDLAMDYEEEMFGDDCCCDDECDCSCEGECHCHDEECQTEEKQ